MERKKNNTHGESYYERADQDRAIADAIALQCSVIAQLALAWPRGCHNIEAGHWLASIRDRLTCIEADITRARYGAVTALPFRLAIVGEPPEVHFFETRAIAEQWALDNELTIGTFEIAEVTR